MKGSLVLRSTRLGSQRCFYALASVPSGPRRNPSSALDKHDAAKLPKTTIPVQPIRRFANPLPSNTKTDRCLSNLPLLSVEENHALDSLLTSNEWTTEHWMQVQELAGSLQDVTKGYELIQHAGQVFSTTPPVKISLQYLIGLWHHHQVVKPAVTPTVERLSRPLVKARQWVEIADQHTHLFHPLSLSSRSFLVHGAVQQGDVVLALDLLDSMIEQLTQGHRSQRQDATVVAIALEKILHVHSSDMSRVEDLVSRYEPFLNLACYNSVLHTLSRHGQADKAEQLLDELCKGYYVDWVGKIVTPDIRSFNIVLNAWSRSSDEAAPERAHAILLRLYDPFDWGALGIKPDAVSWNTVLKAWCRSDGRADAVSSAVQVLREMHEYAKGGMTEAKPTSVAYGTVLDAMAKRGQAERAEKLWMEMYQHAQQDPSFDRPTWINATQALEAWAHSQRPERVSRAAEWHRKVQPLIPDQPDDAVYRVLLSCFASDPSVKAARKGEDLLQSMPKPDFAAYSILIQHWAKLPQGFDRALQLFQEVRERYRNGDDRLCPDAKSIDSILQLLAHSDVSRAAVVLQDILEDASQGRCAAPSIRTLGSFVNAYRKSSDPQAPELALRLVRQMNELHRSGVVRNGPDHLMYQALLVMWTRPDLQRVQAYRTATDILKEFSTKFRRRELSMGPSTSDYNMVIRALARNYQRKAATQLLSEMVKEPKERCRPDRETFNALLWGWAKVGTPDALRKMRRLFQQMSAHGVEPDSVSYNNLIHCHSRMGTPEQAEGVLREMKQCRVQSCQPTPVSYDSVIKGWLEQGQLERAELILQEFHRECMQGTFTTWERPFRALERAWEESGHPQRAETVQRMWNEAQEAHHPRQSSRTVESAAVRL